MTESEASVPTKSPRARWERILLGTRPLFTLLRVLALVSFCFLTIKFIVLPIRVSGTSMEPTYHNGSLNYVNLLAYRSKKPERGDVVSIRVSPHNYYFKRVVG